MVLGDKGDTIIVYDKGYSHDEIRQFLESVTTITGWGNLLVDLSFREYYHPMNKNFFPDLTHPLAQWSMLNPHSWQAAWPGGQCLARYIKEHPEIVKGKTVVDFGCGSGIGAIASIIHGAKTAIANDIDPLAIVASQINAELNEVEIEVDNRDLLHRDPDPRWDVVLVGDALYTTELSSDVARWITKLIKNGVTIFIGDPGRSTISKQMYGSNMEMVATYELTVHTKRATGGTQISECHVWTWNGIPLAEPDIDRTISLAEPDTTQEVSVENKRRQFITKMAERKKE